MTPKKTRAGEVQSDDEPLPPGLLDDDSEGFDIPDLVSVDSETSEGSAFEGSASEEEYVSAHDADEAEGTVHIDDGSEYGETTAAAA